MLRQRIATAIVLLAFLLPALVVSAAWPFALLTLLAVSAAGWEWARLNQAGAWAVPLGMLLGAACALAFYLGWASSAPRLVWWLATLAWVVGATWALRGGVAGWPRVPRAVRCGLGLLALWTAWLAFTNARAQGLNFILSIFCLVWAADVFAYFGGRAFGTRKLAPAISPGKSWEGVWSGMAGALVVAAVWLWIDAHFLTGASSFYTTVSAQFGLAGLVLVVVFLVAMSVAGDLFESLVKRSAGAKDSSALLPGHGGVLDRVDALLPVFPIALALAWR
ncbi:MAG: phosphatidate cytidylyltransferase [Caldimonas sp.]